MRLAWLTDIHWDSVVPRVADEFKQTLTETAPDAVLITGDTATAPTVIDVLTDLQQAAGCPICFVLGNHDYYLGSIRRIQAEMRAQSSYGSTPAAA